MTTTMLMAGIAVKQVLQSLRRTLLACGTSRAALLFLFEHVAQSGGVVVRCAQGVPVAVAFAFVIGVWRLAWLLLWRGRRLI